jgi:hypothetical protein
VIVLPVAPGGRNPYGNKNAAKAKAKAEDVAAKAS